MKKSYVLIHVIKHSVDQNGNLNYRRKNPPLLNQRNDRKKGNFCYNAQWFSDRNGNVVIL